MTLKEPESASECVYFTNRIIKEGYIQAWVFKEECPKCKKSLMGKPKNPKTGRPKIRAEEYICESCGHKEEKKEHEERLTCNIKYKCPYCKHEGEAKVPFVRERFSRFNEKKQKRESMDAVLFNCSKCGEKIAITKKMK